MDYKFTLNLPVTTFSMRADLVKNEFKILNFWKKIGLYRNQSRKENFFILNDGPPYANGKIHIGHAFNKILKDIINKFKVISGYKVNFIPGWDCHGLPIELAVEKKIHDLDISITNIQFRLLCSFYAKKQVEIQKKSFLQLGINADWVNYYKTMDKFFEFSIIKCFRNMIANNHIYRGYKPVYWCLICYSALAEAEIEYNIKESNSIYIFFKLVDDVFNVNLLKKFNLSQIGFVIWTTTPWTLPFNEAVALNFDSIYILVSFGSCGYIFAKDLFFDVCKKINIKKNDILCTFTGNEFRNSLLYHPFYKKKIKIIHSDHVKSDSGTGCVHIAPTYGYDDYNNAVKYNLPLRNGVDERGFFFFDYPFFSKLHINVVNESVIALLKIKYKLIYFEKIFHRYPYCWRHKKPLIFRTTKQWFLNMNNKLFKKKILYSISNFVEWMPVTGKKKMIDMVKDRPDWCLSRQRLWGVPFILFINKKDGSLHPKTFLILEKSFSYIKKYGISFWFEMNVFKLFSVSNKKYIKSTDVLDVWFDSSVVYKYILDNYFYKIPFDLCIEGSDQYRGWFQVSLINAMANYSLNPYKKILTHGFVLDYCDRKMSKSLGNVISPDDVIKKYGADVLRLWVSSVNYRFDVNISNEILSRVSEAYRKIRNTFRFLLSNLDKFTLEFFSINDFGLLKLDAWVLYKFNKMKLSILNDYSNYAFYFVYKKIYNFCLSDLGGKYLDIIKDRLYTTYPNSKIRISAQISLFYICYNLVKLLSPILSFTSEEIWGNLLKTDSISVFRSNVNYNISKLKKYNYFNIYNCIFWDKLFLLKEKLNKIMENYRKKKFFGTSLEIDIFFFCSVFWYELLFKIKDELCLFFLVSNVSVFLSSHNLCLDIVDFNIDDIYIKLSKTLKKKCERCWFRVVFKNKISICDRCVSNLYYDKEKRFYL